MQKPKLWDHAFEFVSPQRTYRLFSKSHDVKEQWVYAMQEYLAYRQTLLKLRIVAEDALCFSGSSGPIGEHQNWVTEVEGVPGNSQGMNDVLPSRNAFFHGSQNSVSEQIGLNSPFSRLRAGSDRITRPMMLIVPS